MQAMEAAKALADAIQESPEYREFKHYKEEIEGDAGIKALLDEYKRLQTAMQMRMLAGQAMEGEDAQRFQSLGMLLFADRFAIHEKRGIMPEGISPAIPVFAIRKRNAQSMLEGLTVIRKVLLPLILIVSVLFSSVAFAAHVNEQIGGGNFQDVLGAGLEGVQIHAAVQQQGDFHVVSPDLADPVIEGKQGGHNGDFLSRGQRRAGKQAGEQDQRQKKRANFFHFLFLRLLFH